MTIYRDIDFCLANLFHTASFSLATTSVSVILFLIRLWHKADIRLELCRYWDNCSRTFPKTHPKGRVCSLKAVQVSSESRQQISLAGIHSSKLHILFDTMIYRYIKNVYDEGKRLHFRKFSPDSKLPQSWVRINECWSVSGCGSCKTERL